MIAAEGLGLPLEDVSVEMGDTDSVQRGSGTFGSKSLQIGGSAVVGASRELVELGKRPGRQSSSESRRVESCSTPIWDALPTLQTRLL